MTVKVSVIISTYSSPPQLDDVVAALDAQSLPTSEYEVVFVDDGSPDDTFHRLQRIAAQRPNVVVRQIENSGWPSRPRNVGIDLAQGEYVFFADHDDYIFPEALERMYLFAATNRLDVVHPKEVVAGWSAPGWVTWRQQSPLLQHLDQDSIQCITPHKLYRRAFLDQAHIRFPEDTARLEDFNFNGHVWVRTNAIGVFSDYPCYRWVIHKNNSHKKGYDYDEYWKSFRNSLNPIINEMPPGDKRNHLLVRWYRSRILERLNGQFQGFGAGYQARLFKTFTELLSCFPKTIDTYLTAADRPRSYFLRNGTVEQLNELSLLDHKFKLAGTSLETKWQDGKLHLVFATRIVNSNGDPFQVESRDGKILRRVPEDLKDAAPQEVWDLTKDLSNAFGEVVIRHRSSNVDWIIPSTSDISLATIDDGGETPEFQISTAIDPDTAAMGSPLDTGVWDVFHRVWSLGYTATHRIPAHAQAPVEERGVGWRATAYTTKAGFLALKMVSSESSTMGRAKTATVEPPISTKAYSYFRAAAARRLSPGVKKKLKQAYSLIKRKAK